MSDMINRIIRREINPSETSNASIPSGHANTAIRLSSALPPAFLDFLTNDPRIQNTYHTIIDGGLLDSQYYLEQNQDIAALGIDPLTHFLERGWMESRNPNRYFDCKYYIEHNPDVRLSTVNPLVHYVIYGEAEGLRPCALFDPTWYRDHHGLEPDVLALSHYLANCRTGAASPHPDFDAAFYACKNPDVVAAGLDLFDHFLGSVVSEGRRPSEAFDPKFYINRYLTSEFTVNPFFDWIARKHEPGVHGCLPTEEATIPRQVKTFTRPGPAFEEFRPLSAGTPRQAKVLALYLPQFHAFRENDDWWGKGFTEWTNLGRGLPRFKGHYQPRTPRDLGHYNLDSIGTMGRQAEMAKAAGVYGFVFYHYWFNGKRLMEKPVERLMEDASIDLPFCLLWANENWTRRWDGLESEVLIAQDYRPHDEVPMIAEYCRYFRDPRYIRVAGNRPLLIIYRPGLIPNARETIARWRRIFRDSFAEDPIIIMSQAFGDDDPRMFGLDGAMEFPPHKLAAGLPQINNELAILDPEFSGHVFRYSDVVSTSLAMPLPDFPLIRGAMPGWDNDARRQGAGMVIHGGTPQAYQVWLSRIIGHARAHPFFEESFVCVNAWNEWAEAAYLEPDLHFGAAFLNATGRAVAGLGVPGSSSAMKLLLLGHDAHPHGAQELLLNIGRTLTSRFGVQIHYLLLDGGVLEKAYADIAAITVARTPAEQRTCLATLRQQGFGAAIVNTTAAAGTVREANEQGIRCINLVHELPRIIGEMRLEEGIRESLRLSAAVVFPSPYVRDAVLASLQMPAEFERAVVQPQGVYKPIAFSTASAARVKARLGLGPKDAMVLGVGYADLRKGFDLFLQAWRVMRSVRGKRVHFCWLGKVDPALLLWLAQELDGAIAEGSFHLPGFTDDVAGFISAASALAVTSREDPFPSVVLEALSAGVPVVAFSESGGIPDLLLQHGLGDVVPYCDVAAMVRSLQKLVAGQEPADRARRQELIATSFGWNDYVRALLDLAQPGLGKVSVAVPNYNYARYLPARLGSIFAQGYPVHETIVLDDCSTDDSLSVTAAVARDSRREVCIRPNEVNSGSVFAQWRKAAEMASGEFVWIAEADDLSDPAFLGTLLEPLLRDPTIALAFSDSRAIDMDGALLGASYKSYFAEVEPGALSVSGVFGGREFVTRFLALRNLILNVSSVVWRRSVLIRTLDECQSELCDYRMAGDWRLYLQALLEPDAKIAYEAAPLNVHRRHAQSVTHALSAERHMSEIERVHHIAATLFGLSASVLHKQTLYQASVRLQLGGAVLASAAPKKRQNGKMPRLSRRLGVSPPSGVHEAH